jgi:predicted membrane-bound mannosyltransferase/DNA-binding beta-propeller fold protein YncE
MSESSPASPASRRWISSSNLVVILLILIIGLGAVTRLLDLGARVMSHDEINHVYWAWMFSENGDYIADPLSHGPFQFHALALSYLLFGDSDFSARLPAALAGIAVLGIIWLFRRWLGKAGSLAAVTVALISPFILYYSRYARNEMFVAVEVLLTVWVVFRYLEDRRAGWLYALAGLLALHAITKETYFLFTPQLLIFLATYLCFELFQIPWLKTQMKSLFAGGLALAVLGFGLALASFLRDRTQAGEAAVPMASSLVFIGAAFGLIGAVMLLIALIRNFGGELRTRFPTLDLIVVIATLTLPQLTALPAQALGWDPLDSADPFSHGRTVTLLLVLSGISIALGVAWGRRKWLVSAAIFCVIFIPFFTTFFTNPYGIFTGFVRSLGYWLVQQGVERGSQPWYYYLLLQIPMYEYLAALGAAAAAIIVVVRPPWRRGASRRPARATDNTQTPDVERFFVLFLIFWAISAFFIYTYAGERMPWLTVHITLPLILLSGWAFEQLFGGRKLSDLWSWRAAGTILLTVLTALGIAAALSNLFGWGLAGDSAARRFTGAIVPAGIAGLSAWLGLQLLKRDSRPRVLRLAALGLITLLAMQTARTALRAAFTNADSTKEFLVYAHAAPGPAIALREIENLSYNLTGGINLPVAYDNFAAYPYWWYLRDYPQAYSFGASPSRELLRYPIVIAGESNYARVEAYLGERYQSVEYERLWWPIEDYVGLTWERIRGALATPEMRRALWDLWFDRDYKAYEQVTGRDLSPRGWSPAERMRVYVREDLAASYPGGTYAGELADSTAFFDAYGDGTLTLQPNRVIGGPGQAPGSFQAPRQIAFTLGGDLIVADSENHRIEQFSPDGTLIRTWGEYADVGVESAPGGTFNQPWGLAAGANGVFIADTWNHRVQRFDGSGGFQGSFGVFGTDGGPTSFYGPRSLALDAEGRVFAVDTGNKRVLVFDSHGTPVGQFGGGGLESGKLDEPVGIAIGPDDLIYIVDTWNQRVQVFHERGTGFFEVEREWPVEAWYGQSIENKPYIAVGPDGQVCVSDPEGARVLCFDAEGQFLRGIVSPAMARPSGVAFDSNCQLWVADAETDQILAFDLGGCR